MIGDIDEHEDKDAVEEPTGESPEEEISDEDVVLTVDEDAGDSTEEIKVDKLVEKIDSEESAKAREIRQKVDALNDQGDDEFGSTYNFDIDKDL